jgi:predicted subunit of tRNA(5-methylaminomethyl-2-thiouridylate) methyltransferase
VKIAVAMSGGVDSSTAAYILKSEGHEVIGLSMQMHDNLTGAESTYGGCCTIDDLADARRVAWKLDIPHFTLNLEQNFHEKVITPFVQAYLNGSTPSPCILHRVPGIAVTPINEIPGSSARPAALEMVTNGSRFRHMVIEQESPHPALLRST